MSRSKFLCADCGVDTGKLGEFYFVNTSLWLSAMRSLKGMLCVGCLEGRIGRRLSSSDFTKATINLPRFIPKSARLMERMESKERT
jgi:hypothetical protein